MAKTKTVFYCTACGNETPKWQGRCPACGAWNTMAEYTEKPTQAGKSRVMPASDGSRKPKTLSEVDIQTEIRFSTGMGELDRVLGGGAVDRSLVLVGGAPGIGKSTLLLQICACLCQNRRVLYISGEESERQLKLRAQRLQVQSDRLFVLSETRLGEVLGAVEESRPDILIADSIQTLYNEENESTPGSVSQVKDCTMAMMQLAKGKKITVFVVGHINKEGAIAGPKVLEHMVDCVLYFEGDRNGTYRLLRAVKNRFGSTNEIGVFEMRGDGLTEVENPSEFMLSGKPEGASGSVVACSMEGTRPILLEIQALVCHSNFGMPRRTAAGTDFNRVNLLMAVLEKRLGLSLGNCDAYINIAGGIRMNEPAIDLGLVLAIVSSYKDRPIDEKTICFGEVGLSGEVRAVSMAEQRVLEAKKLGFKTCILPEVCRESLKEIKGIGLVGVRTVKDAMDYVMR